MTRTPDTQTAPSPLGRTIDDLRQSQGHQVAERATLLRQAPGARAGTWRALQVLDGIEIAITVLNEANLLSATTTVDLGIAYRLLSASRATALLLVGAEGNHQVEGIEQVRRTVVRALEDLREAGQASERAGGGEAG